MASITIEIDDIVNRFANTADFSEGEMAEALNNIAGIIESAIDNAFSTEEAPEVGSIDINIHVEENE